MTRPVGPRSPRRGARVRSGPPPWVIALALLARAAVLGAARALALLLRVALAVLGLALRMLAPAPGVGRTTSRFARRGF